MRKVVRLGAGLIGGCGLLAGTALTGATAVATPAGAAAQARPVAAGATVSPAVPGRSRQAAVSSWQAAETSGRTTQRSEKAAMTEVPSQPSVAGSVTVYPDSGGSDPIGIAAGSDGALWFANGGPVDSIGRITTAGVITHYKASGLSRPFGIAAGSDGALWFTNTQGGEGDPGSIGRITTAGVVTFFTGRNICCSDWIAAGPDKALWFTDDAGAGSIDRITPDGTLTVFTAPSISAPAGIAAGPDGALWFVNSTYPGTNSGSIGRITTSGKVTEYTYPGSFQPYGIAAGPDDALWFTNGNPYSIERITTSGVVTDFTSPDFGQLGGSYLGGGGGITEGPDGALWFTDYGPNTPAGAIVIGRMTASGALTTYINPGRTVGADEIAAGPGNALWFTMGTAGIGRVSTLAFTSGPKLSGPSKVGQSDTCSFGSLNATSSAVSWLVNGTVQKGANHRTFTPAAADLGKELSCSVTLSNRGGSLTKRSAGVKVAEGGALKVVRKPALSGPHEVGKAESVSSGSWSPSAASYSYQWYLGTSKITHATSSRYTPPAKDKGKKLHCVVTAHKPGYANGNYTTNSVTLS